jgi:CelD/BcsL family acetyltransferase involved in cellulose biosynthesis
VKLELVTTTEQFEALGRDWNMLLPSNATNEIFLTWQWQSTWWQAYHPGDLWVLAGRDDEDNLVGIAPWFIEQPARVIRTIGCVEVTDYLDVLVQPARRESFLADVADFVAEHADVYDRIVLCNMPDGTPTLGVLPGLLTERGFEVRIRQQEVCPVITLPADFETYLAELDKKNRHELRRKLRRAEGSEAEKVEWYIVGPQHDLAAEIDKFTKLMAASHPNKAKFLEDPQNMAFFRAIAPLTAACNWLQLTFLTVNGEPAAGYLNFDYNGRILVYNSGLLPDIYAHLSPGIVLLTYNIQYAIEHGRRAFDFLRGNEEYKYRMGGKDQPVMALEAMRAA